MTNPQTPLKIEQESIHFSPRLKTLYLMEHGSTLGKEYERFIIKKNGKVIKQIPAIHVDQIMVFGNSQLTTQVMQFCLQTRIPIYLLSAKGKYYGMVDSFSTEPVLLHREQFLRADDKAFCLQLAKQFIKGKISNNRLLLQRLSRNREAPAFDRAIKQLKHSINQLQTATTLDQLRGYEGTAARINFQAIAATVDSSWGFTQRVKQPPTDPINAMLSYGYTLLFYNIYTFLRARGLNPHVGYLHPMRMGHPALASDVMEEFRSIVVDAVVLNIVFNKKLSPEDFELPEKEGDICLLKPKARGVFIRYLEKKLNAGVTHPVSNLKLDYRRCMEHQVNHLAAVIRERETIYQPIILT
ncbi:MAG: CRISPR-associated endonuclease Cas1 [Cocleimonas sp.]